MNVKLVLFVNVCLIVPLIDYIIGKFHSCENLEKSSCFSRSCGDGVCENCSPNQRPVPERDWLTPVRICKLCEQTMNGTKSKA